MMDNVVCQYSRLLTKSASGVLDTRETWSASCYSCETPWCVKRETGEKGATRRSENPELRTSGRACIIRNPQTTRYVSRFTAVGQCHAWILHLGSAWTFR